MHLIIIMEIITTMQSTTSFSQRCLSLYIFCPPSRCKQPSILILAWSEITELFGMLTERCSFVRGLQFRFGSICCLDEACKC